MGWKDLIFESEPKGAGATVSSPTPVFGTATLVSAPQGLPAFPAAVASVNPAMVADIEAALAKRTPPAYIQFAAMLSKLERSIPDEAQRISAALAACEITGLRIADVQQAYTDRVRVLDELGKSLEAQADAARTERLAAAQAAKTAVDTQLQAAEQDLQRATTAVANLRSKQSDAESTIRTTTAEQDAMRRDISQALGHVAATTTAERARVLRYLNPGA